MQEKDIDNQFLHDQKKLSKKKEKIKRLKEQLYTQKGIRVSICPSRSPSSTKGIVTSSIRAKEET